MSSKTKNNSSNPLLILGWDGAEWSHIERLCKEGQLPQLSQMLNFGLQCPISSLQPMLSPLLWTSVVTGKRAHDHGVLGFVEQSLEGPKAISSLQRKGPALWNILSEAKLKTQVLNWWPSNPAEEIEGTFISNLAFTSAPLKGQCSPKEWEKTIEALEPENSSTAILKGFFPDYNPTQLQQDPIALKVAALLRRAQHQFKVALQLMEESADCRLFYFEALDQLQHLGAAYHRMPASPYQHIVDAAYKWHDAMLGSLLFKAQNHNVLLVSDHGFKLGLEAASALPDIPGAPALDHKPFGLFVAAGPDIAAGQSLFGLSLLDLCPSILHYFKLPLGEDMPGQLRGIFKAEHRASFIPSWDPLIDAAFLSAERQMDTELLNDLDELGYVDLRDAHALGFIEEEHSYNKAISLKEVGQHEEALGLCQKFSGQSPKPYRWVVLQARLLMLLNRKEAWDSFWQVLKLDQQSDPHIRFTALLFRIQQGDLEEGLRQMQDLESDGFESPALKTELGHALFIAGNFKAAKRAFERALKMSPNYTAALNGMAQLAYSEADYSGFQTWANRALQLKMHQPHLHFLWASYYREKGQLAEARKAVDLCLKMAPLHQKARALKNDMEGMPQKTESGIIVSGFPRSGTSFMMRLLAEAGLPIISDNERVADNHNPLGYYEWEGVKSLPQGVIIPETRGKVLKVIAPLLSYLPADRRYKIIWMDRPIMELVLSQSKMRGEEASLSHFPFEKGQQLEAEKKRLQQWLSQQVHIEWVELSYPEMMAEDPGESLAQLSRFLGREIGRNAWEKAAQPELHRNKIG